MTQHDTPGAVEAMCKRLNQAAYLRPAAHEIEAMLRRLHARAVDAEDQASRAISAAENWHHETRRTREALATARADALREAAALSSRLADDNKYSETTRKALAAISSAILALIERGTSHAE